MCDDYGQACALAQKLEETNDERRRIEAELAEVANARASEIYSGQRALVVSGEGWHEGVKGIVANRLVGIYGVPTILFTIEGEEARGSGRSVGQVNLFKAVESTSDLLTRFGGHEAAVGVTLPTKNLPEFTRRLCEYMDTLDEDAFHPRIDIDACVNLDELTIENVEQLEKLAPFGQQNLVPCFMARNVVLGNCRAVGANKNHFSCTLSAGHNMVSAIMFHCENIEALLQTDCVVNASFSLQIDEWRGRRSVKAMLKTLEPTRVCQALNACLDPNNLNFVDDLYQLSVDDLRVGAASGEAREQSSMQDFGQPGAQSAQLGAQSAQLGAQSAQLGGQACEQVHYQTREQTRAHWEDIARKNPAALQDAVVRALIGQGNLHPSQQQILDALDAGQSVLGVMATGRGKSLTFQVHATKRALLNHEVSVFIYPLRALIADQAFHIGEALKNFGITAEILTGESMPEERKRVLSGLGSGKVDIVLTTPEFLSYHAQELAKCGRIGFVVVDEAHHIGLASQAHRAPYAQIGKAIYTMGNPVVLALSATVDTPGAQDIDAILRLKTRVLDNASRDNLYIDDQRNLKNRDDYLAHLVARGEKMLIYVNSREQSIMLARMLRKRVPQLALLIGFYNAGLGREERKRIEELFRTDALSVLVATSAFGEGVNIPNIRHVVLYHMPFNEIEFNQMSGRAGRDGKPATIHLLYGRKDAHINRAILSDMTPDHDVMAQIYRRLRAVGRMSGKTFFSMGNTELAALSSSRTCTVSPASVACGIAVFRELGLVETRIEQTNDVRTCAIHVNTTESKVELVDSVRYREGLSERETFNAFHESALRMSAQSLQWRISHPIVPDGGQGDGGKSDGGRGSVDQANTKANANKSNAQGSGNRPNAPGNGNRPNAQGNTDKFNTNENEVR